MKVNWTNVAIYSGAVALSVAVGFGVSVAPTLTFMFVLAIVLVLAGTWVFEPLRDPAAPPLGYEAPRVLIDPDYLLGPDGDHPDPSLTLSSLGLGDEGLEDGS